jgi:4-hydroxy-2-oxoheptanedioate aldolase
MTQNSWAGSLLLIAFSTASLSAQPAAPKPKRLNKAIDLLEKGQPAYYIHGNGGYKEGLSMAQTWADYINYEMEHGTLDFTQLREFIRGLVDGGPTKSGHRMPAVIVTLPIGGLDEATVHANYWVFQQTLAAGAHGILLCHARSPEGVRRFVESVRYPFAKIGTGPNLSEGLRGSGSQTYAAQMWGISPEEYVEKADVWPLNPKGEILLGIKIEDHFAVANAAETVKVPGIAFAEWGGGDMSMSYGYRNYPGNPLPADLAGARDRVWAACKSAKLFRLEAASHEEVEQEIRDGIMIISAGADPKAAEVGRRFTKRPQPW